MENLVINTSFWCGRRVLITGHTGFKGSWLSLWLKMLNAQVYGYSTKPPTTPSLYKEANIDEIIDDSYEGDIRDLSKFKEFVDAVNPEVVFHLAAQSLVRESYAAPIETLSTNIIGSANILEACKNTPSIKSIIIVTTDKCYENLDWVWPYRESDKLGGHDPYSASKACAELVSASYKKSFYNDGIVATARAGNVIGGGDWAKDRLIPDIIKSHLAGLVTTIRNPNSIRPWQHVLEPLCGYLVLAQRISLDGKEYAQAWNFGPNNDALIPVSKIIEHIQKNINCKIDIELPATDMHQVHEASTLALDSSLAANKLNWHPTLSITQAISWTTQWYLSHHNKMSALSISEQQINAFMERIQHG